jgi:hypothetical protein
VPLLPSSGTRSAACATQAGLPQASPLQTREFRLALPCWWFATARNRAAVAIVGCSGHRRSNEGEGAFQGAPGGMSPSNTPKSAQARPSDAATDARMLGSQFRLQALLAREPAPTAHSGWQAQARVLGRCPHQIECVGSDLRAGETSLSSECRRQGCESRPALVLHGVVCGNG